MKEAAEAFLAKAKELLDEAHFGLQHGRWNSAARDAYLAGFHAAQAIIFERRSRVAKTHSGVRSIFADLARHDPRFTEAHRVFLGSTYNLKAIADYETGPGSHIDPDRAAAAVRDAAAFVANIEQSLEAG